MKSHVKGLRKMAYTLGWGVCLLFIFGLTLIIASVLHSTVLPERPMFYWIVVGDADAMAFGVSLLIGAVLFRAVQRICFALAGLEEALFDKLGIDTVPEKEKETSLRTLI